MDKKKAKRSQLKELSKEMSKMMGESYSEGMPKQKVTVAADSKEGLKAGLDKAKDLLSKRGLMEELEGESEEKEEKCKECEKSPCKCDSPSDEE